MDAWYGALRHLHVGAVMLSGSLFFLRGLAILGFGAAWPMRAPLRYLTYSVDTILLVAALMLTVVVHQYPFVDAWLTAKALLLVVYIGLGTVALKRGKTPAIRTVAFIAALGVFAFIITVAHSHSPLGFFARL